MGAGHGSCLSPGCWWRPWLASQGHVHLCLPPCGRGVLLTKSASDTLGAPSLPGTEARDMSRPLMSPFQQTLHREMYSPTCPRLGALGFLRWVRSPCAQGDAPTAVTVCLAGPPGPRLKVSLSGQRVMSAWAGVPFITGPVSGSSQIQVVDVLGSAYKCVCLFF